MESPARHRVRPPAGDRHRRIPEVPCHDRLPRSPNVNPSSGRPRHRLAAGVAAGALAAAGLGTGLALSLGSTGTPPPGGPLDRRDDAI